jgi:hypothetical protein
MPTAAAAGKTRASKPVPVSNGDFYQLVDLLTPEERAVVKKVRTYMETTVQPVINKYWADYSPYAKGNFSFERVICDWRTRVAVLDLRLKK